MGSDGGSDETRTKSSTFLVTHVDDASAVLRDVHDGQVHTLSGSGDLSPEEVLEATLRAEPPAGVTWEVVTVEARRTVEAVESPESPTAHARELGDEHAVGELARHERAGDGEVHVLPVPDGETAAIVADVLADEETVARAARLGVERVEVRSEPGLVSVRYLP